MKEEKRKLVGRPEFLNEYFYNKFMHSPKTGEFPINFSDISYDASSYIEENFYEYVNVVHYMVDEIADQLNETALANYKKMGKDSICRYIFVFRDHLLGLLKEKVEEEKKLYKMDGELRAALENEGIETEKIDTLYKEWRAKRLFSTSNKKIINFNRHYGMIKLIRAELVNLNNELEKRGLPLFYLNPNYKKDFIYKDGKKVPADYISFRIYNDLAVTKNDIEKGRDYYKNSEERMRSDWIEELEEEHKGFKLVDLGDMSANFPNLLYCIKNGVYLDRDFHTEIAKKYGIDRKVAKMAAVACCFNQTKKQALYHIIEEADEATKLIFKGSGMISEKTGLLKNRDEYVGKFHEWLKKNAVNEYMKNALDMLSSWEACHKEYANDLCKSDLCEFSSLVEIRVIIEAFKKGIIIYNAYDHAYSFNGDYDWKGEYKKWAEIYAVEFNRLWDLDKAGIKNTSNYDVINLVHFANKENGKMGGKMGNKEGKARGGKLKGKRNAAKDDIFAYVIEHGVNEAQKKYGWTKQAKCYWNRRLKKYNAEHASSSED